MAHRILADMVLQQQVNYLHFFPSFQVTSKYLRVPATDKLAKQWEHFLIERKSDPFRLQGPFEWCVNTCKNVSGQFRRPSLFAFFFFSFGTCLHFSGVLKRLKRPLSERLRANMRNTKAKSIKHFSSWQRQLDENENLVW